MIVISVRSLLCSWQENVNNERKEIGTRLPGLRFTDQDSLQQGDYSGKRQDISPQQLSHIRDVEAMTTLKFIFMMLGFYKSCLSL